MPHVLSYDAEGFHTPWDDLNIPDGDELPEGNYTFEKIPQPCMKPKFDGEKWVETIPRDTWPVSPLPGPTAEEELQHLKKQQELMQSALDDLIFSGGTL